MKILNVASILPLKGLKRENDIILRIQKYLKTKYDVDFLIYKSVPFSGILTSRISDKWKKYKEYAIKGEIDLEGFKTIIYSWFFLPTSNFWVNYFILPLNLLKIRFYLNKERIDNLKDSDLILAQNIFPDLIVASIISKKTGKPYIINLRGVFPDNIHKLWFFKDIFKNASKIITHSPTNYKRFKSDFDVKFLPHPVNDDFFKKSETKKTTPIKLVTVCRLLSLKNIDWVIKTLHKAKQEGLKFTFDIIGDGPEFDNLVTLVDNFNLKREVIFHGFKDREYVESYLESSDVFVMPSNPETLGLAFLEAVASSCLCVGHFGTGIDGVFEHYESAILTNETSFEDELLLLIREFPNDKYMEIIRNSKEIVDNFSWTEIGKTYMNLYNSAL